MIHVTVSGASCTGKSTLIKELKKIYPDFLYQKEFVRAVLSKVNLDRADAATQNKIFDAQKKFLYKPGNLIMDRCPLDSISYTRLLREQGNSDMTDEEFKILEEKSREVLQSDNTSIIFFLPIEFTSVDDGYRTLDEEQRNDVENIMLDYINEWGLNKKFKILRGDVDSRVTYCSGIIDGYLLHE